MVIKEKSNGEDQGCKVEKEVEKEVSEKKEK
jgi:hypothetical protein